MRPLKVNFCSFEAVVGRNAGYEGGDTGRGSGTIGAIGTLKEGRPSTAASRGDEAGLLSKKVRKLNLELSATSACAGRNDMDSSLAKGVTTPSYV